MFVCVCEVYVYIYVCVRARAYICVYMYVYRCVCVCIRFCVCIYMYVYLCVCVRARACVCGGERTHYARITTNQTGHYFSSLLSISFFLIFLLPILLFSNLFSLIFAGCLYPSVQLSVIISRLNA